MEQFKTLDQIKLEYIKYILKKTKGNATSAAKILGVTRQMIYNLLKKAENNEI